VAFIGSSLLEGMSGHNLAEAAVAGCAVLVGEHAGHFSNMADELNQAAVSGLIGWLLLSLLLCHFG
jgi:3-deoxy-D-manno-octulosonic-acid transferase